MIGEKIKNLRLNINLTQNKLAQELGISASAVGMYEQSRRFPPHSTILAMCKLFGVSSDYLMFDIDAFGSSDEIYDIIEYFNRSLSVREKVSFNGKPLTCDEIKSVINSIKIAVAITLTNTNSTHIT